MNGLRYLHHSRKTLAEVDFGELDEYCNMMRQDSYSMVII